ncbi:MFS family permease/quinol monooxygenase YgiN [Pseudomonas hunanensis]|uniref:MFS family permease/quinol monooxygenase YgiN n=1 Tax=Pseudomonas hunanensis TaxID=1247546 RepID=A0ACC6JWI5_9PSED|nr:MFS transporter [Pseudomonas hunanensis]MDR6710560.1 MFS family permease/quinol monooxygenase YgiN [Pseudomonas hunanensis]
MSTSSSGAWSPLRNSTFRMLWIATIASNIGTWMHEVGAGWLMTTLSASPLHVALIQVAGSLPMFFLALPAGAAADIVDKRRYLLLVQLWMSAVALALAVLTLLGLMNVTLLLGLTLALGIGTALMMPAWSALTPELVGKDELSSAVAISSVGINVSRAVGPALAGVLVSLVGPWLTFALNAVSFAGVIVVLLLWKREVQQPLLPAERFIGAMRTGLRFARSSKPLQAVLVRALAFFFCASAGMSLLPLIVRGEMHGSAADFGMLLAAIGIGAVAGATLLPKLRERISRDRLVAIAALLYALFLLTLALVRNFYVLLPAMLLSGAAWIAVLSNLQVAAQTSVPAWVRARALSVYILIFFGAMATGSLLWGSLASHLSITQSLLLAAAGLAAGTLLTLKVSLPTTEIEELTPSLHWPVPVLDADVDKESGPVMVTVEYHIEAAKADAFQVAARELEAMRKRNGALSWGLMRDSADPLIWMEFFFEESWLEHLRHHHRVTRAELKIEARVRQLQSDGVPVRIRHLLAGNA